MNIESELESAHTREQLTRQLEQVNREKPTSATIDDQIPAIADVSETFGLDPTIVKTHLLVIFATIFELLGVTLFLFNHYESAIEKQRHHTDSDELSNVQQKIRELENLNRLLLDKLDESQPPPTSAAALSKAIAQILSNHQSGDRLTYCGLSNGASWSRPNR